MSIAQILRNLQRVALLEAIFCPEWQYRYYSYNAHWSPGEDMASMRDGCGSEWFLWSNGDRAAFKVYSQGDALIPHPAVIPQALANSYQAFLTEPAFSIHSATRLGFYLEHSWECFGQESAGCPGPLTIAQWAMDDYFNWAADYYEIEVAETLRQDLWADPDVLEIAKIANLDIDAVQFAKDCEEVSFGKHASK